MVSVSEDQRQRAIEMNRSLRLIKNELESLLEKNVISGDTFSNIVGQLPAEASISNPTPQLPTAGLANMSISPASSASPPTYTQSQAGRGAAAAAASPRQGSAEIAPASRPPPPPLPGRPPLAFAQALYRYDATDERDVGMERGDRIVVLEYMNADWWLGRNDRTGREGIFPQNYVDVYDERVPVPGSNNRAPGPVYNNNNNPWASSEKVNTQQQQQYPVPYAMSPAQGYPMQQQPPPGQGNPYNASVPPMAVAEQQPQQQQQQQDGGGQQGHSKFAEQGKKFGKKLGNAAIFGAGATLGADLVNSIF